MRYAVDVGGVIIEKNGGTAEDTSFVKGAVTFVDGALNGLRALHAAGHELYILSFCGKRREAETRVELAAAGVEAWIPQERWLFCRNRRLKGTIMVEHGIDAIVDDTWDVVRTVRAAGKRAVHFRGTGLDTAANWPQVVAVLAEAQS